MLKDRINFNKYGYYTSARFSRNPNSDFIKYWDEQKRRSIEGYVRESDGEWIPGYLYWYWNFSTMMITEAAKDSEMSSEDTRRADRVEGFPDIWEADYFFFHYIEKGEESGKYGVLLKSRGVGASFKGGSMSNRNFFLLKKSKTFILAASDGYLYDDGLMTKIADSESFVQRNTAYRKRKLHSTIKGYKSGYKDKANNNSEAGYLSEMTPVNVKNPDSSRGKRGKLIIYEEAGSNKHLIKAWGITDKSLNDRGYVFGYQLAMGTGGDETADFKGLTTLFYKPAGYGILSIRNVFDKNANGTSGYFIGEYMNRPESYDENGTTDIIKNLISIFKFRDKLRREIDDADVIAQKKAEGAITPLEAIVVMTGSVFPKESAKMRAAHLLGEYEDLKERLITCRLHRTGETVVPVYSNDYQPINEYPYTGKNPDKGALVLKNLPATGKDGEVPSLRYAIGIDTLDDDDEDPDGKSLFSFQIMDLWTDTIIGWYLARHQIVDNDYEQALSAAIYFNATVNYENNLKGLYGYFNTRYALSYLCDTPQILLDKGILKGKPTLGNKGKGTRATGPVNAWGRRLQADWMRRQHMMDPQITGMDTIDDIEYLREVQMWDPFGNYDKVSAGNMLFILREDLMTVLDGNRHEDDSSSDEYSDPFFDENIVSLTNNNNFSL